MPDNKCCCNQQHQYFVEVYQRTRFVCERYSLKHMINKLLILFFIQMKTKIAKTIPMIPKIFKNLVIQMMMWLLMEFFYFNNNQNNHVCSNDSDGFLGICDPPDVEPDDILEANFQNSFAVGVVENK